MTKVVEHAAGQASVNKELLAVKKELQAISYQFATLYERWSLEQQHVARREAEMSRVIERMEEKIKEFAGNSKEIKEQFSFNAKQMKQSLTDSAGTVATAINKMRTDIATIILQGTAEAARTIGSNAVEGALASGSQNLQIMQQKLIGSIREAYSNTAEIAEKYQEMARKAKLSTWSVALIVAIGVSCGLGVYVNGRIEKNMDETLARKFGRMFDTIDSYTKAIEKSALEKANKNVKSVRKQEKND